MKKQIYKKPKVDFAKVAKSMTLPDQSLSIAEIVKRYVRGVPVDVVQREGVYHDQDEFDYESLSRKDFADQAALAAELSERAKALSKQVDDYERVLRERKKERIAKRKEREQASIGNLDNTMLDDTRADRKVKPGSESGERRNVS